MCLLLTGNKLPRVISYFIYATKNELFTTRDPTTERSYLCQAGKHKAIIKLHCINIIINTYFSPAICSWNNLAIKCLMTRIQSYTFTENHSFTTKAIDVNSNKRKIRDICFMNLLCSRTIVEHLVFLLTSIFTFTQLDANSSFEDGS